MPKQPAPPEPEIHRAAGLGDLSLLRRLVEAGADVNARCDLEVDHGSYLHGLTPLMTAARSIDGAGVAVLSRLLDLGADLRAVSRAGVSAAWYAAGTGGRCPFHAWRIAPDHVDRLRFLLDAGLDPLTTGTVGRSLLAEACRAGDPARVRLLLDRGVLHTPAPGPRRHCSFETPLFEAAESGSADCVDLLLGAGADPNLRDESGKTPLMHSGSPAVVSRLLAAGADLRAEDPRSRDVLSVVLDEASCSGGGSSHLRPGVALALLAADAPLLRSAHENASRLYLAAFGHQADSVDLLLSLGVRPNADGLHDGTPLHGICWQGEHEDPGTNAACERIIRALVAAGNPLDTKDDLGRTPLRTAVGGDWGNATAVRVLLELGADASIVDADGMTPRALAEDRKEVACARLLRGSP